MKSAKAVFFVLTATMSLALSAGTIVYRPNKDAEPRRVANVKIISIEKGVMTIEVNDGRERIPLSRVDGYYDTDLKNSSDGFDDNTPEYTVTVTNIDAPERAQKKVGNKTSTESFKINYRIVPQYTNEHSRESVKRPYFYLYILTEGNDGGGERSIYRVCEPKLANPSKKIYDKAAVMDQVLSSKRENIYSNQGNISAYDRQEDLSLASIRHRRKIIAWRLEIWGKTDIIYEKDWTEPGVRIGKNWWQRL
jgi:hypothetical protein